MSSQVGIASVTDVDSVAVVRFHDLNTAITSSCLNGIDAVAKKLQRVVDRKPLAIVLDFEGKEFVPAAAFECVLVRLHRSLDDRLHMCNLPLAVAAHFRLNRLVTIFQIHDELNDALGAVERFVTLPTGDNVRFKGARVFLGREPRDGSGQGVHARSYPGNSEWIYLADPTVSRRHAVLSRTDNHGFAIEDDDTPGGTFVNGQIVSGRTILRVGDVIKLGRSFIGYCCEIDRESIATNGLKQ